jgi:alkylation response protein AidB-like acyl-CoA dehydrogenase
VQFSYNEDQGLLQDTVKRFAEDRYDTARRQRYRAEPAGYSRDNWQALADIGLLGLVVPVEDGGAGVCARDVSAVFEALGRGMVVEPVLEEIVIAGGILARLGSRAQRQEWLPRIMSGGAHAALAHFERGARFNLAEVRVRAQQRSGEWLLGGEKSVVPWARDADVWIVSAREQDRLDGKDGTESIGFFLVRPDREGVERRDFRLTDGSAASVIRLRNVAAERLPGDFQAFEQGVDLARLAAGAEMLGIMSTLFDSTIEYMRSRRQFGAPLASFQALQHRLARLYVRLEQSRSQLTRAALYLDTAGDARASIAGMKSYVGRAAVELAEACVHLHGGIGMSNELPIGFGFKRILVLERLFGDAESDLERYSSLRNGTGEVESRRRTG